MNKWKKDMMAAGVLLLVCLGIYFNWMYSSSAEVSSLTDFLPEDKLLGSDSLVLSPGTDNTNPETNTVSSYFAAVRLSRQEARDAALSILQEAMAAEQGSGESGQKLEDIVQMALCEAQIESLILAKGYAECVAYMNEDGISIAVASPEGGIQSTDVALIADIVIGQTGFSLPDIRVVEVQ